MGFRSQHVVSHLRDECDEKTNRYNVLSSNVVLLHYISERVYSVVRADIFMPTATVSCRRHSVVRLFVREIAHACVCESSLSTKGLFNATSYKPHVGFSSSLQCRCMQLWMTTNCFEFEFKRSKVKGHRSRSHKRTFPRRSIAIDGSSSSTIKLWMCLNVTCLILGWNRMACFCHDGNSAQLQRPSSHNVNAL